jgi:hypothetical protein
VSQILNFFPTRSALCRFITLNGLIELEGVQQRHRSIEFPLRLSIAGRGKVHRTQLFTFSMLVLLRDTTRRKQDNGPPGKDSPREHLLP